MGYPASLMPPLGAQCSKAYVAILMLPCIGVHSVAGKMLSLGCHPPPPPTSAILGIPGTIQDLPALGTLLQCTPQRMFPLIWGPLLMQPTWLPGEMVWYDMMWWG